MRCKPSSIYRDEAGKVASRLTTREQGSFSWRGESICGVELTRLPNRERGEPDEGGDEPPPGGRSQHSVTKPMANYVSLPTVIA
jgi:hypothetical protein